MVNRSISNDNKVVTTSEDQIIEGDKTYTGSTTFEEPVSITAVTDQLKLGNPANQAIINHSASYSRSFSTPTVDPGANAQIIVSEGVSQDINGRLNVNKLGINSAAGIEWNPNNNGKVTLRVGPAGTSPYPDVILNFPRVNVDSYLVSTDGNNTFNGINSFTNSLVSIAPADPSVSAIAADGTSGTNFLRQISLTNGGSLRWSFGMIGAQSGSTTGCNLRLQSYDNSGNFSDNVMEITRSSTVTFGAAGGVYIQKGLVVNGSTSTSNGLKWVPAGSGSGNGYYLTTAAAPSSSRNCTVPDVGANSFFVMTEGAQTLNGLKTFGTGITLPTTGGTASTLSHYEEYSGAISWSWANSSSTPSMNIKIVRVGALVNMYCNGVTFSAPTTGGSPISTAIPTRFKPAAAIVVRSVVYYGGSLVDCLYSINGDGTIVVNTSSGGAWGIGNTMNLQQVSFTWNVL